MNGLIVNGIALQGTDHISQDLWGHAANTVWVIDGATRADSQSNNETACWVKQFSDALKEQITNKPDAEMAENLGAAIGAATINFTVEHPSATIAMARFTNQGIETLVLGDSAVLVETPENRLEAITDDRLHRLATQLRHEREKARASGNNTLFEKLTRELLQEEGCLRNRENGFWVAQNNAEAAKKALHNFFPLAKRALVMSDGVFNEIPKTAEAKEIAFESLIKSPQQSAKNLRDKAVERSGYCDDMAVTSGVWKAH